MTQTASIYQGLMQPWAGLEDQVKLVYLAGQELSVFTYQLGATNGPAYLLIHGLGDEADTWRHVLRPLAERRRVIALDLPGFGRSDKPDTAYSVAFYKQVVDELRQVEGLEQVTLVGSSMGAAISQAIAVDNPDWLDGLVLVDGGLMAKGAPLNLNLLLFLLPGIGERLYTRLRNNPQAAYETLRPYYANLDGLPPAERDFLFAHVNHRVWSDDQRRAYFSALRSLAAYTSGLRGVEAQLAQIAAPTTIIWGEQDHIMPVKVGQALAAAQPKARWIVMPGAGHLPHQEKPSAWLEHVI
jgi:pimeloyl-ACP methyl ester carboxylesterase